MSESCLRLVSRARCAWRPTTSVNPNSGLTCLSLVTVQALVSARFVMYSRHAYYKFRNSMVHMVLYNLTPASSRKRMHKVSTPTQRRDTLTYRSQESQQFDTSYGSSSVQNASRNFTSSSTDSSVPYTQRAYRRNLRPFGHVRARN